MLYNICRKKRLETYMLIGFMHNPFSLSLKTGVRRDRPDSNPHPLAGRTYSKDLRRVEKVLIHRPFLRWKTKLIGCIHEKRIFWRWRCDLL